MVEANIVGAIIGQEVDWEGQEYNKKKKNNRRRVGEDWAKGNLPKKRRDRLVIVALQYRLYMWQLVGFWYIKVKSKHFESRNRRWVAILNTNANQEKILKWQTKKKQKWVDYLENKYNPQISTPWYGYVSELSISKDFKPIRTFSTIFHFVESRMYHILKKISLVHATRVSKR